MRIGTHRKLSLLPAAVAMTLAISCVSFAPAALAGDADEDEIIELYALHRQECARRPELPGCMGFGDTSRAVAARPALPYPSRAAFPARLGRARHPFRR
jgi:hypothetical protein